jgi:outer membrane protein
MLKRILLTTVATTLLAQVVFAQETNTNTNTQTNSAIEEKAKSAVQERTVQSKPAAKQDAKAPATKDGDTEAKAEDSTSKKNTTKTEEVNTTENSETNATTTEKVTEESAATTAAPASNAIKNSTSKKPAARSATRRADDEVIASNAGNSIPRDVAQEPQQDVREVMAKAYIYNKQLASERESVKLTDENISESISEWMPTVTASGERGKQETTLKGPNGLHNKIDDTADSKNVNLTLPLFDGLRSYSRFKREKSNVEAAKARLKTIEQEVLLNSVIAYMNVVRERESLLLSRDKEQALRKHYDDTQSRFDLGEITQTDVSQSYTRLTRSITDRMEAEAAYESAKVSYQRIVGEVPSGLYLNVQDPLASEEINHDKLIEEALMNNPEIDVAELNVKAAGYDINNKKAALLPSVALRAGKTWRDGGYLGSGINETDNEEVMFNVTVPIYQGGAEYSRIRRAKLTEAKLRYDLEERQNTVRENITRAIHDYKVAVSSIEVHQANVKTAESALSGLRHEVQVGVRTTIDMLDAEQELYEARLLFLRAQRDKVVNAYRLLEQLGRLDAEKQKLEVVYYDANAYSNKVKYKVVGY